MTVSRCLGSQCVTMLAAQLYNPEASVNIRVTEPNVARVYVGGVITAQQSAEVISDTGCAIKVQKLTTR